MNGSRVSILVHAPRFAALALIAAFYFWARLPTLPSDERAQMVERFAFSQHALPQTAPRESRNVRAVHPSLERISAWVSATGAAIALNDLDGDGLPNDVCYVDTRTDRVIVTPAPWTGDRYAPFDLEPSPLIDVTAMVAPMGCLPADINEDGLIDVLVYYWGRPPVAFLRFGKSSVHPTVLSAEHYVARNIVDPRERWNSSAATFADIDGDGHVDLVVGNYYADGARVLDSEADGTITLQHSMSRAFNGGHNRILLWESATSEPIPFVRFRDVEDVFQEQVARGWSLAVGAADLDGDLLPELYFANDFGPDRLLHNRSQPGEPRFVQLDGRKTLTTPNSKVLGRDSFKGMGVDFADLNGDGLLDIYVSNIADEYALQESHFLFESTGEVELMADGIAPYRDNSEPLLLSRSGWGWESRLVDLDNDGQVEALQATGFVKGEVDRWPELHELALGNDELVKDPRAWLRFQPGDALSGRQSNAFFVRSSSGRFYDLASDLGLGQASVSRGIAVADIDGDGDQDFAVANQWETSFVYRNDSKDIGAFLGLHLRLPVDARKQDSVVVRPGHPAGAGAGRPAIGATASVVLPGGRRLIGFVDGGNGHSGARSHDIHFGLGDLDPQTLLPVHIRWRDHEGRLRSHLEMMRPGWHTVLLGSGDKLMAKR